MKSQPQSKRKIDFLTELTKLKKPVWEVFEKYLEVKNPIGHYEMIREYPFRQGKYLRPSLILLALQMFGGANLKLGLLPAAAMQASEDWLLIHDDIQDHSELRRHKPTLNALYGDELAINAGDGLHIIMWKIMADAVRELNKASKNKKGWDVFEKMNEILLIATEGQYLELEWIRRKQVAISEVEYLDMIKRKTAYYTIIGPLQIGAIIAGASQKEIDKIEEWGIFFGYTFQIADDYMNITSSDKKQGKEFAGDILEGKRTLILSHLLSHASAEEKIKIEKIYRKNRAEKTKKDKEYVLKCIRVYGSDVYVKERAQEYAQKALDLFLKSTTHFPHTKAREIIAAGIQFVVNREN